MCPRMSNLLDLPPSELAGRARAVRDAATGTRVTYSPKVFIPLTMLCRDRCGYCTFAQPPARLDKPYLDPDDVLAIARAGARAGCHEALFTLGERPEERYAAAREWLAAHGYDSTVHYLAEMCRLVLEETGLLPHANAGALHHDELERLRPVAASQGMMLESLRPDLAAHRGSPDKSPERRLATLEAAGRLSIPFTTGILVGIGETRADRLDGVGGHRRGPRALGPRAGGHRPELPAQAGHGHAPGASVPARRAPRRHRAGPAGAAARRPRAGASQPGGRLRRSARRRHRRLGRRLPHHRRSRQSRTSLAGPRSAPDRHRGARLRPGAAAHGLPARRGRARPLARPGVGVPGHGPGGRRGPGAGRSGCGLPGADAGQRQGGHRCRRRPHGQPLHRLVLRRRRDAADTRSWCDRRHPTGTGPGGRDPGRRPRRSGPGRGRADGHLRCPGAGGGCDRRARRRAPPRGRRRCRHLRAEPQHQLHQRLHVQVPVLRVLQGTAVAQPARHALPAHPRRHRRALPRGVGAGRHRGLPTGRHPPRLRRRLLRRRRPGREGRGARHPRPRLHRPRGDRGGPATGRAPRRLPPPADGCRAAVVAGHRRRDPRRPGARTSCARTRSRPTSGWSVTGWPTRSACAPT